MSEQESVLFPHIGVAHWWRSDLEKLPARRPLSVEMDLRRVQVPTKIGSRSKQTSEFPRKREGARQGEYGRV